MFVQIIRLKNNNAWYKKKVNHVFEVRESQDVEKEEYYILTKKQLKKMKKARHLEIVILKEDCKEVDGYNSHIPKKIETVSQIKKKTAQYDMDSIIEQLEESERYNLELARKYKEDHGKDFDYDEYKQEERKEVADAIREGKIWKQQL